MGRGQQSQPDASSSSTVPKKKRIRTIGFGGLLKIASKTLPVGFADWLMAECYDADSSELVFLGRGRILVNADSVCRAFGLPNNGDEVKYELDVGPINFINGEYGIDEGTTPTVESILERLKENKISNDDFLRSWLMIAISTFLCPPTGLAISPSLKTQQPKWAKEDLLRDILYVDSLLVDNVQIPSTMPIVAAWSRKLLDQVIKLDTNCDGSFGKLKLKGSNYSTPQPSLFHMDDIRRFVSSKVPSGISDQRMGSSKRPRANHSKGEPSSTQRHNRPKRSKLEQVVPSCAQRQTRAMSRRGHVAEDESLREESEEDLLSDENGDGDTDQDEEDEDSDLDHETAFDDDGNENLSPVLEEEDEGIEKQDEDDTASLEEPKLDATRVDKQCNMQPPVDSSTHVEAQVDDSEDLVPLKVRLERLQALKVKDKKKDTTSSSEPQQLEIIPPEPTIKPKSNAQRMKEKLRLPPSDSQGGPSNYVGATSTAPSEVQTTSTTAGSQFSLSNILEEKLAKLENDALIEFEKKMVKPAVVFQASDLVVIISFWSFYVMLDHLALSVKPGGKLMSPVAEIAIYTIDDTSRKTVKCVLLLRVLEGNLTTTQVSRVFWLPDNHLDHRQMVRIPVLQSLGDGKSATKVGHYFLLVLNLRNQRFEVLDSMRTLEDEVVFKCCNTLIGAIKELWTKHGYEAKKPICNYELVDIGVPIQSNNHDCGFHMLMHAEHWDGRSMQYFKESDIPNIRKLLLYKWLTHKDNVVQNWKDRLHL
ncbi:unnamed protein product [Miscanthus lutarioriparius]|uniref:Ubiquitin-like protease family profile domain-containing protein n=1 Tax=Miscanthus lutarioriparius TaxID=422564 RepID=A0A811N885_9POAL|nr:unnamed protein product [Miscanthus lutarioriparius]